MKKLWFVLLVSLVTAATAGQKLTYVDLVNKLIDLEALSVLPVAGERCAQWSSYDRASIYNHQTGKYENWEANGDGGGIIREEDGKLVFAEIEGPGCIWRIWSAAPGDGHVRIYLDGAEEPSVDLPFKGYFNLENEPFVYPSLVHVTAAGHNCYVPIPFQKSCKITADDGWGSYYHFTYSLFPKGTIVPTFKRKLSVEEKSALARVDKFLTDSLGTDPAGKRKGEKTINRKVNLASGKTDTVAKIDGERAITSIWVKGNHLSAEALRSVALIIKWDGNKTPDVWAPLGDFFGTAPGINKYKSLPLGMTEDGFYSFWYMPFAKGAVVEVANDGTEQVNFEISITHAPLTLPVEKYGRFHAKWHRDAFLPPEPERWIDWTMLKATGRGRYCGVALEVWNPKSGWWGEGDEKFFVDGEKFPSTIGTGSEDYFGYAWCNQGYFQNAFHNQPVNQIDHLHASNNRWHISDNVPFQKSFEGCIEKYYPNSNPTLYACTVYWYLAPGQRDGYEPVPVKERFFYTKPETE